MGGPSIWNLMVSMNYDTGKWSQQYSYSTEDGLFGARVLHNFPATTTTSTRWREGTSHHHPGSDDPVGGLKSATDDCRKKLIDEEEAMDNVLKGRFSVGGELYFSAQRKSAGVSTGIRFCTIPDPPGAALTQQPTVINATLNPIMGQISTSYGTKIGPNLALATRFDFNLFSFDSDITFGLEWLQKRRPKNRQQIVPTQPSNATMVDDFFHKKEKDCSSSLMGKTEEGNRNSSSSHLTRYFWRTVAGLEDTLSILRARVSPVTGLTLMWEGRWKECLIGIGIQSEFLVSSSPSSSLGSRVSNPNSSTTTSSSAITHQSVNGRTKTDHHHHHHNLVQSQLIKGICLELQYTT